MIFSLSFPGCSHPGLVVAPSPGFDFSGLVASGSSELEAAQPVHSVLSLRRILAFVRCGLQSPLVSSLTAARFGFWPYGLAIAALPLVSRPWTGLCWSHLLSLSSQSSIGTKSLPPPSWCLVGVFAMGSPCRVGVVPDLDRNEDSLRTFPSG